MSNPHFLVVALVALAAQACGGAAATQQAAVAPSSPAKEDIPAPPPVTSSVSPPELRSLCVTVKVSGAVTWKQELDRARQLESDLGSKFVTVANASTCAKDVETLDDQVDIRYVLSGTLCDLRNRDGGVASAAFNANTRELRQHLTAAFNEASKARDKDSCKKSVLEAKAQWFDELMRSANAQCSPPADYTAAECEARIEAACAAYTQGKAPGPEASDALACSKAPSTAGDRSPRSAGGLRASDANERSALTGTGLESAILTGAADFLVARAEQEMSLFAVEVLGRRLCATDSKARPFLPKTCELLDPDAEEPVIGATPAAIRAAAKADLEQLPTRAVEAIARKDKNLACAAAFAWGTSDELAHGAALADLLKDLTPILNRPLVQTHCADFEAVLTGLADHLRAQLAGAPAAVADGLRSADVNRLLGVDSSLLKDEKLKNTVREVLLRLTQLDQVIKTYREHPSKEAKADLVPAALRVIAPVMLYVAPSGKDDVYTTIKLVSEVLNTNYAAAVVTASQLKVVQCQREGTKTKDDQGNSECFMPANARNALSLAAELAQAESSEAVRATLDESALPLGSWRRKNEPRWGATLTGMVGAYAAYEQVIQQPAPGREVNNGFTLGPTLLVGFDLHRGLSRNLRLGLHVNILDLGALASIRLRDPKVEDTKTKQDVDPATDVSAKGTPEVRFEQVFAPGLFPYFGFGPFDLGPAVTFVPSLRPARMPSGDIESLHVLRYGLVLAVDVSMLPIW